MADYHRNIFSDIKSTVTEAFFFAIGQRDYFLTECDLKQIENKFHDQSVSGWVFAYRVYASPKAKRNKLLRSNAKNKNPRIREQVCDIIGDEFIDELRSELKTLFNDPVPYVSQAARYNHDEMF